VVSDALSDLTREAKEFLKVVPALGSKITVDSETRSILNRGVDILSRLDAHVASLSTNLGRVASNPLIAGFMGAQGQAEREIAGLTGELDELRAVVAALRKKVKGG
jgi:hypothetical protein